MTRVVRKETQTSHYGPNFRSENFEIVDLDRSSFSINPQQQILTKPMRSQLDSLDLARFDEIELDFGQNLARFANPKLIDTHLKPIRLDIDNLKLHSSWLQVKISPTRCYWVKSELGTNLIRPNSWTTLVIIMCKERETILQYKENLIF